MWRDIVEVRRVVDREGTLKILSPRSLAGHMVGQTLQLACDRTLPQEPRNQLLLDLFTLLPAWVSRVLLVLLRFLRVTASPAEVRYSYDDMIHASPCCRLIDRLGKQLGLKGSRLCSCRPK